jgi:hypothetical protein
MSFEGKTEVEVELPKFPGQTVAGYDFTEDVPELSGLISTIAAIINTRTNNAAETLWSNSLYKPVSLSFFITIALPMRAHDDGDRQVAKE